jgi:hypothetical protein
LATLLSLGLIVSGCGSKAATPPTPTSVPTPKATPIPPILVEYASGVQPLIRHAQFETSGLLAKTRTNSNEVLGLECTNVGNDLASAQLAIRGMYTPGPAHRVYDAANAGYKLILVGTDECAMAADGKQPGLMTLARQDMRQGMRNLATAFHISTAWHKPK